MKKLILTIAVAVFATISTKAQFGVMGGAVGTQVVVAKVKLVSGDAAAIKGKSIKVVMNYDGMIVSKYKMAFGKKISEAEFIKNKSEDLNKKEAGKGDAWAKKWEEDKASRYAQSFITKYNEDGKKKLNTSASTTEGELTLEIKTTYMEPGYFIGIDKAPAILNMTLTFKNAAGAPVLVLSMEKVAGQAFGFGDVDTGARIAEGYEKCAKEAIKIIEKKAK
jgi:hypothetical protein